MSDHSPTSLRSHQADLFIVLALIAVGVAIYGQTLNYPFISLDDPGYVVNNPHVTRGLTWEGWKWAWTTLAESNWHPLTWLSLMLDAQFYGLNAGGYHLTNLLLHVANTILVFCWLRTATGARWPSALTAFLFAAHPLHVESVAWVTERKDVLSAFFFLLTLLAYTRYARGGGWRYYGLALGLFAVGLTAKPMLVTLPPLLLLLDYWPLRRWEGVRWRRLLWEKVPFAVLAVASSVVTVVAQRAHAMVAISVLPIKYRAASMMLGYGSYLQKTLLPLDLGVYYPYWQKQSMVWPFVWLFVLLLVTLVVGAWRKKLPWLLVGWGWFLGMLVPVIGVVQVGGQATADRYAYLPHVGLFIAVFWTGASAWKRWPRSRAGLAALTVGIAGTCTALSYQQTGYWRDSATLFAHTIKVVQPTPRLFHLLGDALVETHQLDKAVEVYLRLRDMGASNEETTSALSTLLLRTGRWSDAIATLRPWRDRPDITADLLNNYAFALNHAGQADEALAVYRQCVTRFPDYALSHFGLAEMLATRGDLNGSAEQDAAGLTLQNDWLPALIRLAWDYAHGTDKQTLASSLGLAQRAVDLTGGRDPGSLNVLALAQAANGEWTQATATADRALDLATHLGAVPQEAAKYQARLEAYQRKELPL